MLGIDWPDLIAPACFFACWAGYTAMADGRIGRASLMSRMHEYRLLWMRRMLTRDNRIHDLQVLIILTQSNAFFASSIVLVIGGCIAVLGAREEAMAVLNEIPFVPHVPPLVWQLKVMLLVIVFGYAFFKFTWSLRQFNYVAILIGAAPPPMVEPDAPSLRYAENAALIASRAAEHFNKALRTFYFGLAALGWFLQPWLLVILSIAVTLVLYRREFHSNSLRAVGNVGEPIPAASARPALTPERTA